MRWSPLWVYPLLFGLPVFHYPALISAGWTNWTVLAVRSAERKVSDEEAVRYFAAARRGDRNAAIAFLEEGRWRLARGEPMRALDRLSAAIERDPGGRGARFFLGIALLETGRVEEAAVQFRRSGLPARSRGEFDLLVDLGWRSVLVARESGDQADWQRAENYYRAALAAFPEAPEYWLSLAQFYADLKPDSAEQAIELLGKAKSAFPESGWPFLESAVLQQRLGQSIPALAEIRSSLERGFQGEALFKIARRVLRDLGKPDAETWVAETRRLVAGRSETLFQLDRLLQDLEPHDRNQHDPEP